MILLATIALTLCCIPTAYAYGHLRCWHKFVAPARAMLQTAARENAALRDRLETAEGLLEAMDREADEMALASRAAPRVGGGGT